MGNIPKALVYLKQSAGPNWNKAKAVLSRYLLLKKRIQESNLSPELGKYFAKLEYARLIQVNWRLMAWGNSTEQILFENLLKNVLTTLYKIPYDSGIACYIQDSYNRGKSGNKKYPNL